MKISIKFYFIFLTILLTSPINSIDDSYEPETRLKQIAALLQKIDINKINPDYLENLKKELADIAQNLNQRKKLNRSQEFEDLGGVKQNKNLSAQLNKAIQACNALIKSYNENKNLKLISTLMDIDQYPLDLISISNDYSDIL